MATTTSATKTVATSLVAWADIANAAQTISSAQDVSTKFAAAFNILLGRRSGSAFTSGWPNVRIEASGKASGNDSWVPLFSYQMQLGASIATTTLNGAVSAGSGTITVASGTNIAAGDLLFLGHTTLPANYELVRVKSISGTTVTLEENCTNAHDNGAPVTDQAESTFPIVNLAAYSRVRVVVDNAGSGQTIAAQVLMTTLDSLSNA
jgi:hypothetical protein